MTESLRRAALAALSVFAVAIWGTAADLRQAAPPAPPSFARQVEQLSEPGGAFDTDNLISNETTFLRIAPDLAAMGVHGGAYLGVGPDQNFSYIARVQPAVAYIVDIRRDNLLLHLLFKAIFELAPSRVEYLCLLTGRPLPPKVRSWDDAPVEQIASYVDATEADATLFPALRQRIDAIITKTGVAISHDEWQTIARFHQTFVRDGLGLRFNTFGRRPQFYYPTFRDLILATDAQEHRLSYLASSASYQFVRNLEQRDLVVPVTGDLGGSHALHAIADDMTRRHVRLSAFYVSNVENYLFRDGRFPRFLENLARLPRAQDAVVIRSIFGGGPSVSAIQPLERMLGDYEAGRYRTYNDLVGASLRKARAE